MAPTPLCFQRGRQHLKLGEAQRQGKEGGHSESRRGRRFPSAKVARSKAAKEESRQRLPTHSGMPRMWTMGQRPMMTHLPQSSLFVVC